MFFDFRKLETCLQLLRIPTSLSSDGGGSTNFWKLCKTFFGPKHDFANFSADFDIFDANSCVKIKILNFYRDFRSGRWRKCRKCEFQRTFEGKSDENASLWAFQAKKSQKKSKKRQKTSKIMLLRSEPRFFRNSWTLPTTYAWVGPQTWPPPASTPDFHPAPPKPRFREGRN